jgi:hypothetical protein
MHNKNQTYSHKKSWKKNLELSHPNRPFPWKEEKKAWASNLSLFDNHTTQNHQNIHTHTHTHTDKAPNLVTNSAIQMITTKPQTGSSTPKARTSTHYFPPILLHQQEKPSLRITKCTKSNNASQEFSQKRSDRDQKLNSISLCIIQSIT